MGSPVFVARLRVTNEGGVFDSLGFGEQPRISFTTTATLEDDPNTATIGVYNLSPQRVAQVTGVTRKRVDWTPAERAQLLAHGASTAPFELVGDLFGLAQIELSWGYADSQYLDRASIERALSIGFLGTATQAPRVERNGLDDVLTFQAQDGGHTLGAAEVVQATGPVGFSGKSYIAGTSRALILADLINAIGLSADPAELNAQLVAAYARKGFPAAEITVIGGYNSAGPARPQIRNLLESLDLRWSIQRGVFLILDDDSVIPGFEPFVLSSELGNIIGKPKPVAPSGLEISIHASTETLPGRPSTVLTETLIGSYRIEEARTQGDTYTGGQTSLKLVELQTIPGVV